MMTAFLHRRCTVIDIANIWVTSFLGNLAGMLFFMAIITGCTYHQRCSASQTFADIAADGGVFEVKAYRTEVINFATIKCLLPQWHQIFLRAIGANWLVCFAVFISISSREISSKIIAIWWPTMTFVALGLDHVIANM